MGLCFAAFLDPPEGPIPMDDHDVPMHQVATELGITLRAEYPIRNGAPIHSPQFVEDSIAKQRANFRLDVRLIVQQSNQCIRLINTRAMLLQPF